MYLYGDTSKTTFTQNKVSAKQQSDNSQQELKHEMKNINVKQSQEECSSYRPTASDEKKDS